LAAGLCWADPVLVAECDPAGSATRVELLAGQGITSGGLLDAVVDVNKEHDSDALWRHVVPVGRGERCLLLPGLTDPQHAVQLDGAWGTVVQMLTAAPIDVIADVGRVGGRDAPYPLLTGADLVVMVLRPTLRQVAAAKPRLQAVQRACPAGQPVGLCLVGNGPYDRRSVGDALALPVVGVLPDDEKAAAVLSDGAVPGRGFAQSALMRGATRLAGQMRRHLYVHHPGVVAGSGR
jgi:hypothetical protein